MLHFAPRSATRIRRESRPEHHRKPRGNMPGLCHNRRSRRRASSFSAGFRRVSDVFLVVCNALQRHRSQPGGYAARDGGRVGWDSELLVDSRLLDSQENGFPRNIPAKKICAIILHLAYL